MKVKSIFRELFQKIGYKKRCREQYIKPDFPYSIGISLGEWECNRKCRMCPQFNSPPETTRYISEVIFNEICSQIGSREVSIEISAYGEPFMHPMADKFLFTARKMCPNATIVVATNGSLLTPERCELIVKSGIDHLSFSLDAGSRESYNWLCKSTDYDEVCKNLETLVSIRNNAKADHLHISAHIIGVQELSHEFDLFVERWSGIVDNAYVRTYGNWAGMVDNNGVSPAQIQLIPNERYPCAWLWYATKIEPNGDVSKCFVHVTGEKNPLGNIMEKPLEEIWKGTNLERIRHFHCINEFDGIEYCKDCIVWSLFPNFWKKKRDNIWTF